MNSPVTNWRQTKNIHSKIGKTGTIISWTRVFVAPSGFETDTPYFAGIVEFAREERSTMQFVGFEDEPRIGQKVITVVRRIGRVKSNEVVQYGIKAALLLYRPSYSNTGSEEI